MTSYAGGRVFGERVGVAPPVVLGLHGWRRDRSDLLPALGGLQALSLDLPGFGSTPAPATSWGAADYAELVATVIAELPEPVVVLGHSFGGRVAVALGAAHPELVRGLVLTGVPLLRAPSSGRASLGFRAARALNRVRLVSDTRMEALRRTRGSADYQAATGVMRDVLVRLVNESYDNELRALRCPVRMVWGELDTAAPVAMARAAAAMIADCSLQVLDGVDHFVPNRAPAALNSAVRSLVAA